MGLIRNKKKVIFMNKKTIFKGVETHSAPNFAKEIEISSPSKTHKILIKLGKIKIYLTLDTAEELAKTLQSDISILRDKIDLK